MGEAGERDPEETDFASGIAMLAEETEQDGEDVGIELRGLGEGPRAGVGIKAGVTDGQRERARRER